MKAADLGELLKTSVAAYLALRSYQYGNASTDLAEEVADSLHNALCQALAGGGPALEGLREQIMKFRRVQ